MTNNQMSGKPFWYYVRHYLTVYLPKIRYLSPQTIDTYRQSIAMFCTFLKEEDGIKFSVIAFEHATRDSVVRFIQWLQHRQCRPATCNLRLSSLKSFLKYCADEDVSLYSVYQEIQRIPVMKDPKTPVQYLSETALKTLLSQPDNKSTKGRRNSTLVIFLYDTGVRVGELVELKVSDLHLQKRNPFVIVTGKGSKTRSVPLMDKTVTHLKEYIRLFHNNSIDSNEDPLFFSIKSGKPHMLSTDAVAAMLAKQVKADLLIIATNVDGIYDKSGKLIKSVGNIREIRDYCLGTDKDFCVGGMATKLEASRIVTSLGIPCVISNGKIKSAIYKTLKNNLGTHIKPEKKLKARKHWLAYLSKSKGAIIIDSGAEEAVVRRGKSILPKGILKVEGSFDKGELITVLNPENKEIARGITNYSSTEISKIKGVKTSEIKTLLGKKKYDEVVYRDNLVLTGGRG